MLKNRLLHPEILRSLATAGHGSKVLIADGNYPYRTGANPDADRVYLNFSPGVLNSVEVLEVLAAEIPIEAAEVMLPASGEEPAIFAEFRSCLPAQMDLNYLNRFEFYEAMEKFLEEHLFKK